MGRKQRAVALGVLAALVVAVSLFFVAPMLREFVVAPRGLIWATATAGPLVCLLAAVGAVGNHRFFSRADMDAAVGGPPSESLRVMQAILQNTLEQAVLAIGTYGLLSFFLPTKMAWLPMLLSGAFVAGRLAFALGYRRGAAGRAFGFALTAYPTAIGLGYGIYLAARWWW